MLKGIEIIKDRLQRKRKQYIHQGEKIEQMKCTMQNTGEEIEQLQYVLNEMEHIADVNRAPRVIPNARVEEVFAYLCRVFEFLQHRLKLHFKYKLACEVIFAYYQFKSRLHTPGREYLSFATILTYFKRERNGVWVISKISKYRDNSVKNKCFRNRNDEFDIFSSFLCVHF